MHHNRVLGVAQNLSELLDYQTTVQDLLEEEGDNATIETQALSVIISKTLQQTCSWVRTHCSTNMHCYFILMHFQLQTVWNDKFNCSSAVEFKRAMVKLQLHNSVTSVQDSLMMFPNASDPNNSPDRCSWTKCNLANSSAFNYTLSTLKC